MNILTKPMLLGSAVFLALAVLSGSVAYRMYNLTLQEELQEALNIGDGVRSQLETSLQHGLSATQTLALLLAHSNIKSDFPQIAKKIFSSYTNTIDAIELAPQGIVRYAYPYKENEAAIGFNILEDPLQRAEALAAIKKRRLIFAGPLNLIQGGVGVVGRLPVFEQRNGKELFWGFSLVVIKINTLLKAAKMNELLNKGYEYQLSRMNPITNKEEMFARSALPVVTPVLISVNVPNGKWMLSLSPTNGWTAANKIIPLCIFGFIISVLGGIIAWNAAKKPQELKFLVKQKTSELNAIFHALPDLYFRLLNDGTIVDYRSGQPNMALFLPPEKFIHKKFQELLPSDVARKLLAGLQQTSATYSIAHVEYSLIVNNAVREYEARFSPLNASESIAVIRDITERKKAEELLRLTQFSIDNAVDAVYWMDANGKFVHVNNTASRMLGYTQEEFLSMNVFDIDADLTNEQWEKLSAKRRSEKIIVHERTHKSKSGLFIPVEISSNYVTYQGKELICSFARNITERKKAEELLRSSEERFSKAFRISPDSININRLRDGLYLEINEGFTNLTGYAPKEVVGKTSLEINIWADSADRDKLVSEISKHGEVKNFEAPFRMKNGEIRIGLMSARVINVNNEQCLLSITRDITERKQMEKKIRKMNEELEQRVEQRTAELVALNKELESFSYSVSHDLRAPLRAIEGFASILYENYWHVLNDDGKNLISRIKSSIKKMDLLINGLLTLSRVGRSELKILPVDMNELALQVCAELIPEKERKTISLAAHVLPPAAGDSTLLRQVWTNLISNAVKYSKSKQTPAIEIGGAAEEGRNVYYVKDNGVGFNQENSKQLFGIFQRLHTDSQFDGVGVGLSIVKRIVQRHGGEVWCEGKLNEGAVFYFSLPLHPAR